MLGHVVCHAPQLRVERAPVGEITLEGLLGRDRDPFGVELEIARVDAAGAVSQQATDLAGKHGAELDVGQRREPADRGDPRRGEALLGARPHAREDPGGERVRGTRPRDPAGRR